MPLLEHDNRCDTCYGSGIYTHYDDRKTTCEACAGTGRSLTEIGRELIQFLRDHYGLEPKG